MPHGAITKPVVVTSLLTSGYTGNLAKGQLAVVKNKAIKGLGAEVISDFAGMTAKDLISFKVGEVTTPSNLRIKEVSSKSTGYFPIGSIVDIKAYAPSHVTLKVDNLEVGYDGINADTALFIPEGKSAAMDIMVYGQVASMFFGRESYLIQKRVSRRVGETMQKVIRRVVKELNDDLIPTASGWASTEDKLSKFLEIGVIDSEATQAVGVNSIFSTISIKDNGDSNDLGDIQAQYPLFKVVKTDRQNGVTTYTILRKVSDVLANYSKVSVDVIGKDCADCQAGYNLLEGGYVYHVSLEDDGTNSVATVQALPTAVASSAVKFGNKDGKGTYSVVLNTQLTNAQRTTFLNANVTAELSIVGEIKDVCNFTGTESFVWVDGEICTAITKEFKIILKDNECGQTRLAELQAAYPELTIVEGGLTGVSTRAVTLTGASGDASLVIDGVTYTTAFITSLTATAAAFVLAHAPNILANAEATVTSTGAVITITAPTGVFPSIVAVAGGLTEAVGVLVSPTATQTGGCKRVYSTSVSTNLVCSECSPIYLQPFYGEAPLPFGDGYWEEAETAPSDTAKMGIFVKGKPFFLYPEAHEEDFIPFMETSLKVRSASFGWREDDILNYTGTTYDVDQEFAKVVRVETAQDVDNLSQDLFGAERMGNQHYTNKKVFHANLFARTNLSQERILGYNKRMVQYHVQYQDTTLSQMAGGRSNITHDFMIIVEQGKHQAIETVLGKLAAKVGIPAPNVAI
jgi:hypothetical protein